MKKNNTKTLFVIGHAIISKNCCIANDKGTMPKSLKSEKDWELFQKDLNQSDLVIIGRKSYELFYKKERNRLIPTSQIKNYFFQNEKLCFFNPSDISLEKIINLFSPYPKKIAVVGGQRIYELVFDQLFYKEFHLSIKINEFLQNGQPIFKGVNAIEEVKNYMEEKGLRLTDERNLDSETIQCIYTSY